MKWIRLWVDETLNGSTFEELRSTERGVWFSLLPLAAIGQPPHGTIKVCDDIGYTNKQIASLLKVDLTILAEALEILKHVGKISISDTNVITILNWHKYQTEYERQKKYRKKKGLQKKVTT